MATSKTALRVYLGLVVFSILGTAASSQTGLDPGPIRPAAAILTLLAGVWALVAGLSGQKRMAAMGVLVAGAFVEILGLYTGFPFGSYSYHAAWFPTVVLPGGRFFPLLLPFAWLLVVGGSFLFLSRWLRCPLLLFATSILATGIDLLMEPVMTTKLGYWTWHDPVVLSGGPLMNVFGWLVTSWFAALILYKSQVHDSADSGVAAWVLGGHVALVLAIGFLG